jgi:signal transduction histidine kinase
MTSDWLTEPLRVLVVDDDFVDRLAIRRALKAGDPNGLIFVEEAVDRASALGLLTGNVYSCALLDFRLPDGDAHSLLQALNARGPARTPIVILTGLSDKATAIGSLQEGAQDFLGKANLDSDTLLRSIRYAIERFRIKAELERLNARLAASNRDLDAFAGRIAHDLRNTLSPLTLLTGMLRMMAVKHPADAGPTLSAVERITGVVQRADGMIEELLAFSRAGQPPDRSAVTELPHVLQDVVDTLKPLALAVGARVELHCAQAHVRCSAELYSVVAMNVIGNAIKFLAGRETRQVRVSARPVGDWLVLTVEDTGPGIPKEALEKIFEPFYRVPGREVAGTGIGLATVRRVVTAYGGHIETESSLDAGTVFRISLPLSQCAAAVPSADLS